jgi:hypothetical protein
VNQLAEPFSSEISSAILSAFSSRRALKRRRTAIRSAGGVSRHAPSSKDFRAAGAPPGAGRAVDVLRPRLGGAGDHRPVVRRDDVEQLGVARLSPATSDVQPVVGDHALSLFRLESNCHFNVALTSIRIT